MAGAASDYHKGEQDITEQRETFHAVMNMTKWGCLVLAAGILMLVIWFCTTAGFVTGLIAAVVVLAIGITLFSRGGGGH
jgi:hypothetical protein